ncbi:SPOR domain-containing protein [Aquimarina pacifica]|uniref:SPOR domain-containing protein n=1 Tax=Aquimarina pacifica TaxID=1296415 RepID=UPI00046F9DE5|nr:SPOR domain-containing protein [Aquimarina pacifica]
MRLLNTKNSVFIFGLHLLTTSALIAQESQNTDILTPNQNNFTSASIISQPEASVTINQDPRIKTLLDIKSTMEKNGDFSDRYKIQLYYGNLRKATEIITKAKEMFPKWVSSTQFETPNYKVWMGNYRSRLEADRALKEVHAEFPNAFIFKPEKK